jgi:hypothetical protein
MSVLTAERDQLALSAAVELLWERLEHNQDVYRVDPGPGRDAIVVTIAAADCSDSGFPEGNRFHGYPVTYSVACA